MLNIICLRLILLPVLFGCRKEKSQFHFLPIKIQHELIVHVQVMLRVAVHEFINSVANLTVYLKVYIENLIIF